MPKVLPPRHQDTKENDLIIYFHIHIILINSDHTVKRIKGILGIMDSIFILAQTAGLVAMCFSIFAWQLKKQEHILMCYVPSRFFWSIQFFLLGAHNAALFSFVCMFKDCAIIRSNERGLKYIIGSFIIFNIGLILLFYKTLFDILPLLVTLLINLPLLKKDNRYWMARCNIAAQLCWIMFNLHVGAYMGFVCACFIIISSLIGMARHENWEIGRCHLTFIPTLTKALLGKPTFRKTSC
jgi:hypothetical protein